MINYKYYIYYQNVILLKLLIYNLFNLIQIKHNQILIYIYYQYKNINDIGAKYLGLALSKLIKLNNLTISLGIILFIVIDLFLYLLKE